ncbi:MAG TPA: MarR family transcriptional regulator, partial [Candidatus Marinimicrobia bacterium]|nr:MarR family transcriptional regulator [Candidatus Neomarinimicrobiota bacterium]
CMKDKTSITRIVDMLEKKNLVVRVNDQLDQRIKRVVLTHEGKQLFNNVVPIMEKNREEVRQGISDSEIDAFKRVLIQINKNMNPENG